jgi:hypothetical protein
MQQSCEHRTPRIAVDKAEQSNDVGCDCAGCFRLPLLDGYSGQHRAIAKAALEAEFSVLCSCRVLAQLLAGPAAIEKKGSVSEKEFLASGTIV